MHITCLGVTPLPKENVPGSKSLFIKMVPGDPALLSNPKVQNKNAQIIFDWMIHSLPHGIYRMLIKKILDHENKLVVK
jgi:hypothetical protein